MKVLSTQLDSKSVNLFYYQLKNSPYYSLFLYVGVILVAVFVFILFTIPQVQRFFSVQSDVAAEQKKVSLLQNNVNVLKSTDDQTLNDNVTTAFAALPSEKDVSSIIEQITDASTQAGVSVDDYTFSVGSLKQLGKGGRSFPVLTVTVTLSDGATSIKPFISAVEQHLPLSAATAVSSVGSKVSVILSFYLKELPHIVADGTSPIPTLSAKQQDLLEQMKAWQQVSVVATDEAVIGTSSASPL